MPHRIHRGAIELAGTAAPRDFDGGGNAVLADFRAHHHRALFAAPQRLGGIPRRRHRDRLGLRGRDRRRAGHRSRGDGWRRRWRGFDEAGLFAFLGCRRRRRGHVTDIARIAGHRRGERCILRTRRGRRCRARSIEVAVASTPDQQEKQQPHDERTQYPQQRPSRGPPCGEIEGTLGWGGCGHVGHGRVDRGIARWCRSAC